MTGRAVDNRVVVRGAGEVASGVIRRLVLAGYEVVVLEIPEPCFVRRYVCYADAVYNEEAVVEGIRAVLVKSAAEAIAVADDRRVPILIDPRAELLSVFNPMAVIDGRMLKTNIDSSLDLAPIVIGLGPGFTAGENCHAAVETNRGDNLGKVLYTGSPQADTGVPSEVNGVGSRRVLRSPADGTFLSRCVITDVVKAGQVLGEVAGAEVAAQIDGMVRGLLYDGLIVSAGQKIGDIDPRAVREHCFRISDKSDAIGRGALRALQFLLSNNPT